ncbi:MATE family efflux transporter [Allocoprobacillus halotolerans]|uniref:MATE family efflux transporter n=1 Tax=Allocoprobacillus halotolerans TaxID=2944914 RepID=A0ABY5I4M6_9FIRM|nr:MATE family efflux transporter [Allocoprobacillus halotolerans]UTY40313.1 MATE family efflux transporter [Allocoprobacillus halotolerans]
MGAAGAALATLISNCISCLYFIILLIMKKDKTSIRLHPKYLLSLNKKIVYEICNVGIPASIQNLLNVTTVTVMNNFVSGYDASAIAAVGIVQKIYMIPLQIATGGTQGIMPLISYSYTSKNKQRFKETIYFTAKLMIPSMCIIAVLCWFFSAQLTRLFIDQEQIIFYGTLFLRGYSASMSFMLVDFMAIGVFQSVGMGKNHFGLQF